MALSVLSGNTAAGTSVLGSANGGMSGGGVTAGALRVPADAHDGWLEMVPRNGHLTSAGNSTRMDGVDGSVTASSHTFTGLPVVGFTVRTFQNGTLSCGGASCQGNYGSAFPLKYQRSLYP